MTTTRSGKRMTVAGYGGAHYTARAILSYAATPMHPRPRWITLMILLTNWRDPIWTLTFMPWASMPRNRHDPQVAATTTQTSCLVTPYIPIQPQKLRPKHCCYAFWRYCLGAWKQRLQWENFTSVRRKRGPIVWSILFAWVNSPPHRRSQ
jgi:hypothetical protein